MILITAGAQLSFERLAEVALVVSHRLPEERVIYQAGPDGADYFADTFRVDKARADNLQVEEFIEPVRYRALLAEARCVVTHAGMGNVIQLLEAGALFWIFPRMKQLGEHRSDHQLETARAVHRKLGIGFYTEVPALMSVLLQTWDSATLGSSTCQRETIDKHRRDFGARLQRLLCGDDELTPR